MWACLILNVIGDGGSVRRTLPNPDGASLRLGPWCLLQVDWSYCSQAHGKNDGKCQEIRGIEKPQGGSFDFAVSR